MRTLENQSHASVNHCAAQNSEQFQDGRMKTWIFFFFKSHEK